MIINSLILEDSIINKGVKFEDIGLLAFLYENYREYNSKYLIKNGRFISKIELIEDLHRVTKLKKNSSASYYKKQLSRLECMQLLMSIPHPLDSRNKIFYLSPTLFTDVCSYTCNENEIRLIEKINTMDIHNEDGLNLNNKNEDQLIEEIINLMGTLSINNETSLPTVIRSSKCIQNWRQNVLAKYRYKCALSGVSGNLEVHHLYSFNLILKECLEELHLDNKNLYEITIDELSSIRTLIDKRHTIGLGIPLTKELHRLFHSIYGNRVNTEQQFLEFKNRYFDGEFDYINKGSNLVWKENLFHFQCV